MIRHNIALFACIGALAFAAPAFAQSSDTVNTQGLSAAQVAELEASAAKMRDPVANDPTLQTVTAYVEVGKGIGAGMVSAAKELGVAANDFAVTPLGQITIALIIFKVAGGQIIGIVGGLLWFAVMLPLWVHYFNRICMPKRVEDTFHENGKRKTRTVTPLGMDSEAVGFYRSVGVLLLALVCVAGFMMIF